MADPSVVALTKDVWTKAATNINVARFNIKISKANVVYQTYRMTGNPAPTDLSDAVPVLDNEVAFNVANGIDVYFQPAREDSSVIVRDGINGDGGGNGAALIVKGAYDGLKGEYTAANQITLSTGECLNDAKDGIINVDSPILATMPTDLDVGSETANTWYYIWLFYNPITDDEVVKFSISPTAPTEPSGYTRKRLVGAVRNDASSNFLPYSVEGKGKDKWFLYEGEHNVLSGGASTGWTPVSCANFVPPISTIPEFEGYLLGLTAAATADFRETGTTPPVPKQIYVATAGTDNSEVWQQKLNSSQQFDYRTSSALNLVFATVTGFYLEL
jgi:hypothetical protein